MPTVFFQSKPFFFQRSVLLLLLFLLLLQMPECLQFGLQACGPFVSLEALFLCDEFFFFPLVFFLPLEQFSLCLLQLLQALQRIGLPLQNFPLFGQALYISFELLQASRHFFLMFICWQLKSSLLLTKQLQFFPFFFVAFKAGLGNVRINLRACNLL